MKKSHFEDKKIREAAAHEAGHILGVLIMATIKNCHKVNLNLLAVNDKTQTERFNKELYGKEYLKQYQFTASVSWGFESPSKKRSLKKDFRSFFTAAIMGRMGICGSLSLYKKDIPKDDLDRIVQCGGSDIQKDDELITILSKFTGYESEEILEMIYLNCMKIIEENKILFNTLTKAVIQSNFILSNESIFTIIGQYGVMLPDSIQQDIDKLEATTVARILLIPDFFTKVNMYC